MSGRGTDPWRCSILAFIVATTCISAAQYPANWTERVPVTKDACPDVSGVYSNRGEVHPSGGEASLNLFFRPGIPLLAVTQVEIARSDRFLEISLWSDGKVSEKRRLERGVGFECGPNGLELLERGYSNSDAAVNVGASFTWGKVWMTKGGDGSLVVHTVDNDLFILILVPLYGRQTLWYRFPVESAGPRQDGGVPLPVADQAVREGVRPASLDEVITRTIEASGGSEAWKAFESARIAGRMVNFLYGKRGPFLLEFKRPNKWRREVTFKGKLEITTFDGETGWFLPAKKRAKPKAMTPIGLIGLEVPLFGPLLLDYSTAVQNIELVGEENVDGIAAYKIKVTRDSGDVDHIYVDAERFLIFRLDRRTRMIEMRTSVGNYKRVGALMFPHTLDVRNGTTLALTWTIDRVELNPGIGDDRFAMPRVSR